MITVHAFHYQHCRQGVFKGLNHQFHEGYEYNPGKKNYMILYIIVVVAWNRTSSTIFAWVGIGKLTLP